MLSSSLSLQQTVRIVIIALAAAFLFLVTEAIWQIEAAKRDFESQRQLTAASLRSGLSAALFNFDEDMTRAILRGVVASRPIRRIDVTEAHGRVSVAMGPEEPVVEHGVLSDVLAWMLNLDVNDRLVLTDADLSVKTRWRGVLGEVRIVFDDSKFVAQIANRLANQFASLVFMIVVLAATTSLMIHDFISRHVKAIAHHLEGIPPERPDDHPLPVPVRHGGNELGRLVRQFNDLLSRLAQAQEALEASEVKYKTIVERTPVAMMVHDSATGDLLEVNASACAMLGYGRADLLARSMCDLLVGPPEDVSPDRSGLVAQGARHFTVRYRTKDRQLRTAEVFAAAISLGEVERVFSVMIDVTDRLRIERDRDETLQMALSSKKAQADFLASMSHELRTPLNAILGFAEVIKGELMGPVGVPQYRAYAEDIHASGTHLLSLINDILDLSRIETGHAPLEAVTLNLRHEINKAVKIVEQRLEDSQLHLSIDLHPSSIDLVADRRAVRQMLINLLSNATKFTPPGGAVTISATRADNGTVRIAVSDTGIGIPAKDHERIFQAFRQAINTQTREIEGSGLGLALVKSLVERHGGRIELVSASGEGATFTLVFPPGLAPFTTVP